ncbi:MAG: transporter substrate-binding domain-containing protein, partial [Desulfatitalea sp.]|nr:transporter substrate-binding domain-containing protein [Desulfatitalea sp.]
MKRNHYFKPLLIGALSIVLAFAACGNPLARNDLEAIQDRGELVVITRNNAACYFESAHGMAGFEFEMASAFADALGVSLRMVVIEDEAEMVATLLRGEADIIAAGKLFGLKATRMLALGPGYLEVSTQIVGRRGGPSIEGAEDLAQTAIGVAGDSAAIEQLNALKAAHPELSWHTFPNQSSEELLLMIWNRDLPLAVVQSNILKMNRRFYPELM